MITGKIVRRNGVCDSGFSEWDDAKDEARLRKKAEWDDGKEKGMQRWKEKIKGKFC